MLFFYATARIVIPQVVVVQNGRIMYELQTKYQALSVDIHPGGTIVAVGGSVSTRQSCYKAFKDVRCQ